MMVKNVFLTVAILLLALAAVSCAGSRDSSEKELVLWTDMTETESLRAAAERFRQREGWKVRIVRVPFEELKPKYQTAAPVNKGPDVITGPHDWVGNFAVAGLIDEVPLGREERSEYLEVPLQALSFGGRLCGLPISIEAAGLIYNKEFVKKAPETMDDLIKISMKANEGALEDALEDFRGTVYEQYLDLDACKGKKLNGFLYEVEDFYFTWAFFGGYGAYIFRDTPNGLDPNDNGMASPEALKAMNFICDLNTKYHLIPPGMSKDIANARFMDSSLLFTFNGPWALADYKKRNINCGFSPLPKLDNGVNPKVFVGVQGIYLNKRSRNKDMAVKFMKEICGKEGEVSIYLEGGRIPSRMDAQEDPRLAYVASFRPDSDAGRFSTFAYAADLELKENEILKGVLASAAIGTPMPNIPEMNTVWQPMKESIQLIFRGKADAAESLREASDRIRKDVKGMMD